MFRDKTTWSLSLAVFLMMVGVGAVVTLLPSRMLATGASPAATGLLTSAFAVPYVLLQLPLGMLADRLGFRPLLLCGYLLCGLTGMVYAFSGSIGGILAARALQGLGEAPVWSMAPALLASVHIHARGRAIGAYNAAMHLGLMIGPLLVALHGVVSGKGAFLLYAALCFLGMAILAFFLGDAHPAGRNSAANVTDLMACLREREIRTLLRGVSLYGAGYGILITVVPALLAEAGYGERELGWYFAAFYAAIAAAQMLAGRASDRLGRRGFLLSGLVAAALGVAIFPLSGTLRELSCALASLGLGSFCLAAMAALNDAVPDGMRGAISGAFYLFWGVGYFAGPLLFGLLEAAGSGLAFSTFAALLAAQGIASARKAPAATR